eukprot:TRINITY_DN3325_c0_g1_i1.p1 TRINITY_DN3325_c0_g1~~TRINITY_DN3325_c0_g1_i1.p1  ORF type:complete len:300 (+),score=62.45 TRINITY_DN3325_c0_g1_i1:3-902(+)
MIHLQSEEEFDAFVLTGGDRLIVVDFYADWCGPCRMIAPEFESLSVDYPAVTFIKVNSDHFQGLSQRYGVSGLPTFLFFKNGTVVDQVVGANVSGLKSAVSMHSFVPEPVVPKEFQYFPQDEFLYFSSGNVSQILSAVQKLSERNGLDLDGDDIAALNRISKIIENESYYHATRFQEQDFSSLLKIVQFPADSRFPGIDLLRLTILHPHCAEYFSKNYQEGTSNDILSILISYLLDDISAVRNFIMIFRFLVNCFKFPSLRDTVYELHKMIIVFVPQFYDSQNTHLRLSIATLLFKFNC